MSTTTVRRNQMIDSLRDKEYRDLFVAAHIRNEIAFQIRAIRESLGWTQAELGERIGGKVQESISQWENPNYGKFTLNTLRRLASAFDVGLVVRFAPFSELVDWITQPSPADIAVPIFDHDTELVEPTEGLPSSMRIEAFGPIEMMAVEAEPMGNVSNIADFARTCTGASASQVA